MEKQENKELNTDYNNQKDDNSDFLKSKLVYQIDNKKYILQMFILQEIKKIKIFLEVTDKNKTKTLYLNTFTLNDLISKNNFFSGFKDFFEAFTYLLKNSLQVCKTEYIPNKKAITILLAFSVDENIDKKKNNQDTIEFILYYKNISLNKSKSNLYLNATINNLKSTLEQFNSSINELKLNIDNNNDERNNMKNQFEKMINNKLNELMEDKIIKELNLKIKDIENKNDNNNKEQNELKKNLEEIQGELEKYDNDICSIVKILDENDKKINSNLMKNNQNQSTINNQQHIDIMDKIKIIEDNIKNNKDKNKEFETNINKKISELNNNIKNANNSNQGGRQQVTVNLKNEDNEMLDKIIQDKINKEMNIRMKIYDEKIQILNKKIIDLEIKNQNKMVKDAIIRNEESSFIKDSSYIDFKFHELEEKINKNYNPKSASMDIINSEQKEDKNNNKQSKLNEKRKITNDEVENKTKELVNNKIEDLKKEMYSMMNKINEQINNNKNISFDNKLKNYVDNGNKSFTDLNKSADIKIKDIDEKKRQKNNTYKQNKNNKNFDINTSLNLNKTYLSTTARANDLIPIDGEEQNITFRTNTYNNKRKKQLFELNIESKILKKEDLSEDFFLFSKIRDLFMYNRYMKLSLIYRGSKDGATAKDFHMKCDLIGPNITLIKTKKNYIFGGFTNKGWKHLFKDIKKDDPEFATEYKDERAFGFSYHLKKIYENGKPQENIIFCNNSYGAVFNSFFKIFDDCFKNGGICGKMEKCVFIGQEKNFEFNGGEEKFEIDEIEVFQILFR